MNFPTTSDPIAIPQTAKTWQAVSPEQTTELLQSIAHRGLSSDKIYQRQQYFGKNELKETGKRSPLTILWDQFTNIMLVMLIVVAVVSATPGFTAKKLSQRCVAKPCRKAYRDFCHCNFKWNTRLFSRKSCLS